MDGKKFYNLIDDIENMLWIYGDDIEWWRIYTPDEGKYELEIKLKNN